MKTDRRAPTGLGLTPFVLARQDPPVVRSSVLSASGFPRTDLVRVPTQSILRYSHPPIALRHAAGELRLFVAGSQELLWNTEVGRDESAASIDMVSKLLEVLDAHGKLEREVKTARTGVKRFSHREIAKPTEFLHFAQVSPRNHRRERGDLSGTVTTQA